MGDLSVANQTAISSFLGTFLFVFMIFVYLILYFSEWWLGENGKAGEGEDVGGGGYCLNKVGGKMFLLSQIYSYK